MKKLFLVLLALALCGSAFAQLPTTCVYIPGGAPTPITFTVGSSTYQGVCIAGIVYQTMTLATGALPNLPPLAGDEVAGFNLHRWCHARYVYSADGGVHGSAIVPVSGCTLPKNAVVENAVMYVSDSPGVVSLTVTANGTSACTTTNPPIVTFSTGTATATTTVAGGIVTGFVITSKGVQTSTPTASITRGDCTGNVTATVVGSTATLSVGWTGAPTALLNAATMPIATNIFEQSAIVPQTASGFLHLADAEPVVFTIGTADLTAGVVDVWVEFVHAPF